MKKETIKSSAPNSKPGIKPDTKIQLEKQNLDLQIQTNELQNKILENRRKILEIEGANDKRTGLFDECDFPDFPDE